MTTLLRRLILEEQGQDLIEYALLAAFIALAATAALVLIGPQITAIYTSITGQLGIAEGALPAAP